jgi:uncharacterized protein
MKINEICDYVEELKQFTYCFYFKPYTLQKQLEDIHPELNANTNPFYIETELEQNIRLYYYTCQVYVASAISLLLLLLVFPLISSLLRHQLFDWQNNGLTYLVWIVGVWLMKFSHGILINMSKISVYIVVVILVPLWIAYLVEPSLNQARIVDLLPLFSHNTQSINVTRCIVNGFFVTTLFSMSGIMLFLALDVFSVLNILFLLVPNTFQVIVFITVVMMILLERNIFMIFIPRQSIFVVLFNVLSSILATAMVCISVDLSTIHIVAILVGVTSACASLRVYFWIPEFIWMLGLKLLRNQKQKASLLHRLPPYFDQFIILPLPFMVEIIIEAHRQNPVAARSTIDYFITSTNQQTVAKQAMFGIGVETLNQCRYVSDIIGSQIQLDWLPTDDQALGTVLPRLLEISHNIGTAYQATTAYNRLELVDRSILDLQKLQTSLSTAVSAGDAPLFGTITMRWLQILKDNRQALETAAQASAEIPNPYLAGPSLEPADAKERFKGRQDLFRAIEDISLSAQPPVLLLYGRRRTGKTSTLKYLPTRVSSDLIPLLVDFQGAASIQRMENIAEFIATAMTKTAKSARNLNFPTISPAQLSHDPFYALQTWMEQIEQMAPNKRFLLCIDEFERLEEVIAESGSYAPLNFLRYVTQNCRQWIVLFSGAHRLEELKPYWNDYLIGTRTLSITYLQAAEARELIQQPVTNFPDIYTTEAVDEIVRLTRGQPYLVQLLCSCVVEYLNSTDEKRQLVTVTDVEAAKSIAWERGEKYFQEFWTVTLTAAQREFLHRLLMQESTQDSDRTIIRQLIQSEVIERDYSDNYHFQVPLIQQYLELAEKN